MSKRVVVYGEPTKYYLLAFGAYGACFRADRTDKLVFGYDPANLRVNLVFTPFPANQSYVYTPQKFGKFVLLYNEWQGALSTSAYLGCIDLSFQWQVFRAIKPNGNVTYFHSSTQNESITNFHNAMREIIAWIFP